MSCHIMSYHVISYPFFSSPLNSSLLSNSIFFSFSFLSFFLSSSLSSHFFSSPSNALPFSFPLRSSLLLTLIHIYSYILCSPFFLPSPSGMNISSAVSFINVEYVFCPMFVLKLLSSRTSCTVSRNGPSLILLQSFLFVN